MALGAVRIAESEYIAYKRVWRGSVFSTIVSPILFLAGMGFALGTMVDRGGGEAELPIPFLTFVATGLIAATAMQTGFGNGAWPVMAGIKWRKTFDGMLVTPIDVPDIVGGRVIFEFIHALFTLGVYAIVAVIFGAVELGPALLSILPAALCGLAFNTIATAYTAQLENETGLSSAMRFAIVPLFLFSGTFFPISQLPDWMEPIAYATPLFHGVELTRKIALPDAVPPVITSMPLWIHVAYLVAMFTIGWFLSIRQLRKRLQS